MEEKKKNVGNAEKMENVSETKKETEGKDKVTLHQKLQNIQTKISVPKSLFNRFGKYYYRNCETIFETIRPFLIEEGLSLIMQDEIVVIGDKFFMKANAILTDVVTKETITNSAYAELSNHTGMTADQQTGTASSYARKYCLNGLFLLDDVKDADSDEYQKQSENMQKKQSGSNEWGSPKKADWKKPAANENVKW